MNPTTNSPPLKSTISWCLYDFANSSFFSVITTFIFAAYFTEKIAPNSITGTHWWGLATAFSALIVAITSPVYGAIADYGGYRKRWLLLLTYIGILASAGLWFAYPNQHYAVFSLVLVIIGTVAFETGMTFYNALLPSVTPPGYIGRISGWAWGLGYAGGLLCLIILLFGFIYPKPHWLNIESFAHVRISGPFIAAWILIFSLPLFLFVPDLPGKGYSIQQAMKFGINDLLKTLRLLPKEKNYLFFFGSRIFYIEGLNTLFAFGGIYAAGTFGMSISEIALFGIILNITAGIGAGTFAWIDDWIGAKKTILISLALLIIFSFLVLLIHSKLLFWIFAPIIGIFVGPIQSASRSLMVRIAPKDKITEMFGLFAFSGKATAFIGPWLVAEITSIFLSQRAGMSVITVFYILGFIILCFVTER